MTDDVVGSSARPRLANRVLFAVVLLDAVLLAVLELFFLPLRLDGVVLPKAADVPVPISVVLAMVTTPLLVLAAAPLVRTATAMAPPGVWVLTVLLVGLAGPGGDLVLIEDWRGLLLLAGGALPAAMAIGAVLGRGGSVEPGASTIRSGGGVSRGGERARR